MALTSHQYCKAFFEQFHIYDYNSKNEFWIAVMMELHSTTTIQLEIVPYVIATVYCIAAEVAQFPLLPQRLDGPKLVPWSF